MQYAVCEIKGKQYLVKPKVDFEVDFQGGEKTIKNDKVLLVVRDGKLELGKPYLKTNLEFEVLEDKQTPKLRVATYKAKANYRRVIGSRRKISKIRLVEKK
ncbi:50S ribosomal protein L21 [Patescibacteria group bacterium]|nr:50S ribosomal protein L21 [Patescibacteria group bacterium]MCL5410112.1 50S ribosomal protein L21 [Patescibacteria group bacterium]